MRRNIIIICFITGICFFFGACSKSESYADKINREKKNIKNFINDHNIVVRDDYPSDGVFDENEYYLDPSGVYINVIDSGNGKRASNLADVYYRFTDNMELPTNESDTLSLINMSSHPLTFRYGDAASYSYNQSTGSQLDYYFLCPGIVVPLKFVGEGAVVRLIVPFKSTTGSVYQSGSYVTMYYSKLEYTKIAK